MTERALAGLVAAAAASWLARRVGSLSTSGALAATLVGAAAVAAGWSWGALLVLFFVSSVALSRLGAAAKARRTAAIVAKGGARDAIQVLANGGVFAALALASTAGSPRLLAVAAAGALAAAAADTWATEVGTSSTARARSLRTLRGVEPGTSGAVTLPGSIAMLTGAVFIAGASGLLGVTRSMVAVAVGGIAGALADSILGATAQQRRWCDACERATERRVHDCGTDTRHAGGLAWLDNDAVNFAATLVGAATAAAIVVSMA